MGVTNRASGRRRIGVFGGSFDPPHVGHLALAQTAVAQLRLDELRVIPTGQAWHKARGLSDAHHRVAMVELAFASVPQTVVDSREIRRSGPSYTFDTLTELRSDFPDADLFLILGQDQAQALPTWHRFEEVCRLAIICVAVRADFTGPGGIFDAQSMPNERWIELHMPGVPLSATHIRQTVASHQSISALVIDSVARYIAHHHLYLVA
jgi:nicotinate-nucleotide adenylyltransferase